MPLQNRVDPWGSLHATPIRGTLMGNRGNLHDQGGNVVRQWRRIAWVTCALSFGGRQRKVFAPGQYSELFFLDEATALAAGHRPCAECRRERFKAFKDAWSAANRPGASTSVADMDHQIHEERVDDSGRKRTFKVALRSLPAGVMCSHRGTPHLVTRCGLREWTFSGYGPERGANPTTIVDVLTPRSVVAAIDNGYVPALRITA